MTTLSIVEARNKLAEAINHVIYGGERILLARRGKPVVALVSADDLKKLEMIEDAEDLRDAKTALREYQHNPKNAVTLAEYRKHRGKQS